MDGNKTNVKTRIWDIWIRVFHWSLVASVGFMLISGETGFLFFDWHRKIGELVLVLILFRLIWGFIGSSNARLIQLIVNPLRAFTHLTHVAKGSAPQERKHNAAGGWAVLIMLALISFQAISGIFIADEDELIEGAFYGSLSYDLSERLLHLHHLNADILMIIVGAHVVMVFFYLFRAGQNLIVPMITGKMRWRENEAPPEVTFANPVIGLVLAIVCFGAIGLLFGWFG